MRRYMIMVKGTAMSEAGVMPEESLMAEMATFHEQLAKAGVLVDATGLQPTSQGSRIKFSKGKRTVVDGPFAESKEIIAGYTVIQANSREEAMEWFRKFPAPFPGGEGEIEIRPFFELEDFEPNAAVGRFKVIEEQRKQR